MKNAFIRLTGKSYLLVLILMLWFTSSYAKITRIEVTSTLPYKNGKVFGQAGSYQQIKGYAYGEIDPANPLNSIIQDIKLAPKNSEGMVEYVSEFIILCPAEKLKSNGLLFMSLPNRGNAFGADEVLLKRGYTVLWCAWQGDVLPGDGRLTMKVPVATENGKEISGLLRTEFSIANPVNTLNLSSGVFTGFTHHSYETVSLDNKNLTLTIRIREGDPKIIINNSDWAFSDCTSLPFPGTPSSTNISLKAGFDPNYIYELVYKAKNPLVLGLGFAAIRDITSLMKRDINSLMKKDITSLMEKDGTQKMNPDFTSDLNVIPIKATIIQGVSQCSNFIRTFLDLGFNQDEEGKKVFDGVNAHIGTRRISLNIRFGRPGGGGMQHEEHLFPVNLPPFTWDNRLDAVSGTTGGILASCSKTNTCPLIMQTLTSTEYWQSRASLTHTESDGTKDLPVPENVRIYLINGTEHSPMSIVDPLTGFNTNNNPVNPTLRALLIALEKWVIKGTLPPESAYPTLAKSTLVQADKTDFQWPAIPGIPFKGLVNNPPLLDFGRNFSARDLSGELQEPPEILKDKRYIVLVPKVDSDGNEEGGIQNIAIRVPVGTYTGWSLRKKGYGEGDLASLNGMFIPFKLTRAERLAAGDPRLSLEERYTGIDAYTEALKKACEDLVKAGFLLEEDVIPEIENAKRNYPHL
ncbi:alpha/beta hydrolase domain-containing protein [Pedobacter sp. UYP1]|uniref:alpha/beta hydrolase domain-containing protein n=1 Tax=Pedobacter sp. UYP1 TaxID=1756396 RepID=UPI00339AAB67